MKNITYICGFIFVLISSCSTDNTTGHEHGNSHADHHGHDHGDHSEHQHDHSAEGPTDSRTIWSEHCELFVEFKPLVVGEISTFTTHLTELSNYSPVEEGEVVVSLIKAGSGIRDQVNGPVSPGIFTPYLKPAEAGVFKLVFNIRTPSFSERFEIENVQVYNSLEDANKDHSHHDNHGSITLLKEQSWNMEFSSAFAVKDTMYDAIHTGAQILPAVGDEQTLSAPASGILIYATTGLTSGASVTAGQHLFTITGGATNQNNVRSEYLKAKSHYENAKTVLERKKLLYDTGAISKAEHDKASLAFELAESEYRTVALDFSENGKIVRNKSIGYVKNLLKQEGEYVEMGEPLVVTSQNKKLTIRADVSQSDYPRLSERTTANFLINGELCSLKSLNGQLLSFAKSVTTEKPKIPVYFEIENYGSLLPGSFIEVWVKTNPRVNVLQIPASALLEDYGVYSVIVQTSGESFEKREIRLGVRDGINVEILSGLQEGERVVTKGAYQVKMASMSAELPAHGHVH